MPELPEVEIIVRQLREKLSGQILAQCWSRPDAVLTSPESEIQKLLLGQSIQSVVRKGKYLSLIFPEDRRLWFHLGMTGQLLLKSQEDSPDKHVHLILSFGAQQGTGCSDLSPVVEAAKVLWFRDIRKFGEVFVTSSREIPKNLQRIAPDPFEMTSGDFVKRFKTRSGKIKSLLLDQHLIAGLGNIYANESLYRAKINPRKSASQLSRLTLERLFDEIQDCLKEAILGGGSSIDDYQQTDGSRGSFQKKHQVYGRFKKSCLRCGQLIRKIILLGRSTFYCSRCQR